MNTVSIKRKLRVCKRCEFACTRCPHVLPCEKQGQRVRPMECYLCWHNQGTILPKDCAARRKPAGRTERKTGLAANIVRKPTR